VLYLIADGYNRIDIAKKIGIAPETVKEYSSKAKRRLGAKNAAHAVSIALRNGIIE